MKGICSVNKEEINELVKKALESGKWMLRLSIAKNQLRDGETRGNGLGGDVNEAIAEAGWPDKHGFWLKKADKSVRNVLFA